MEYINIIGLFMDFKKKTLLIIIAGAAVVVALIWKVAIPLVEDTNKLGVEIKNYQDQVSEFTSYTNYMTDLKSSYMKNENKMAIMESAIVTNTESGKLGFLKEVESISDKTFNAMKANILNEVNTKKNMKKTTAPKDAKSETPSLYSNFALNLQVRGTFFTLLEMLVDMENMPYYSNIDSISISAAADGKSFDTTTDSNIKLKVFTKP